MNILCRLPAEWNEPPRVVEPAVNYGVPVALPQ
jgi:hypothetical protein